MEPLLSAKGALSSALPAPSPSPQGFSFQPMTSPREGILPGPSRSHVATFPYKVSLGQPHWPGKKGGEEMQEERATREELSTPESCVLLPFVSAVLP